LRIIILTVLAGLSVVWPTSSAPAQTTAAAASCVAPGGWIDGAGATLAPDAVYRRGGKAPVVLLGESHESAEDHRWQLQALAGLYAVNPRLAVGMEMFPRRLQPVLDRWVAGELDEQTFLRLAEWDKVWGYDAAYYLPFLHFARMNRLPLIALNVERSLVSRTAREGWAAIPADEREGVGNPAPVTAAYRERLAAVAAGHGEGERRSTEFDRFIEAQSVWDRAMAEAAAAAHLADGRTEDRRTVAAIIGRGHAERRDGVIHQLADLGLPEAEVWLPWEAGRPCNTPEGRVADAMFGAAPPAAVPRARLGVELRAAEKGLTAAVVTPGSVAAAAGLKTGDVILSAAGRAVRKPSDLISLIRAMPAGAWLPLEIRRGRAVRTVVAKFPVETID
jgi:uncharacterized iron-regulated protein